MSSGLRVGTAPRRGDWRPGEQERWRAPLLISVVDALASGTMKAPARAPVNPLAHLRRAWALNAPLTLLGVVLVGTLFAALVGVLSGVMPARSAAKLDR